MIKILHTSDWHAGKVNLREPRREDLQYALDRIKDFIKQEKVDCLLVSGDIFDKPVVSPQDMSLVWNFFLSISSYGVKTVVISGNHDSSDYLASMKEIMRLIDVYIFHKIERDISKAFLDFELGRDQKERISFFALPYVSPRITYDILRDSSNVRSLETYIDFVSAYLETAVERYMRGNPTIMISHLAIAEAKPSGTEKEISLRADFCIPHTKIPSAFVYYALGHIHRYQRVSETKKMYYSGSIYQIDFGEEKDEKKGFNFITIKNGYIDKIEFCPIGLKRRMKTYEFDLSKRSLDSVLQELISGGKDTLKRIFLYFNEEKKYLIPEFLNKIKTVEGVISINFESSEEKKVIPDISSLEGFDLSDTDIITLYERFYSEFKKESLEFFNKSIRPYVLKIIEKYKNQG